MTTRRGVLALGAALLLPAPARGQSGSVSALRFSDLAPGTPLPGWLEPVSFGGGAKPTQFALVADEGRTVLRARAQASASGLARALRLDPATHPILAWRWKARNLVAKGRLGDKAGDDFALRLYVVFDLPSSALTFGERLQMKIARALWGDRLPSAALCYVWDGQAAAGAIAPNAYTDRVRMVVAESGAANLGRWVDCERDVAADFRRAFGLPAPAVTSLIVSADTDTTGESTEAWFGDAEFRAPPGR